MNRKNRKRIARQTVQIVEGASGVRAKGNYKTETLVHEGTTLNLLDGAADAYKDLVRRLLQEGDWGEKFSEKYIVRTLRKLLCTLSEEESVQGAAPDYIDDLTKELDSFSQKHTTYIPLSGIKLYGEKFEIGNVKLVEMSDAEISGLAETMKSIISTTNHSETEKKQLTAINRAQVEGLKGTVCAEFEAVAEPIKVRERGESECRRVFDLMRYSIPFLYPEGFNVEVGFLGEVFRSNRLAPTYSSANFNLYAEPVGPLTSFDISPKQIEAMGQLGILKVSGILQKSPKDRNPFEKTLLRGIHWVADAQVQPETANRFLSLITCLETFLTPKNREPISNAVAEGVAMLLRDDLEGRKRLKSRVKNLYGVRSGVSHGGDKAILDSDLAELNAIARTLIQQMISRKGEFSTRDDLLSWIEEQKLR